jgi:ribosomal protein L35
MPKLKTKSGAKKRFALTGTGKIKRKNAYKSHILTKKEAKEKSYANFLCCYCGREKRSSPISN